MLTGNTHVCTGYAATAILINTADTGNAIHFKDFGNNTVTQTLWRLKKGHTWTSNYLRHNQKCVHLFTPKSQSVGVSKWSFGCLYFVFSFPVGEILTLSNWVIFSNLMFKHSLHLAANVRNGSTTSHSKNPFERFSCFKSKAMPLYCSHIAIIRP